MPKEEHECEHCGMKFVTEQGLGNHIRQKHPEEYESWKTGGKVVEEAAKEAPLGKKDVLHYLLKGPTDRTLDGLAEHFDATPKKMAEVLKSCENDGTAVFDNDMWWSTDAARDYV